MNSTLQNSILVGIASSDFDFNANPYYNNGWYICLCCGNLFSGAPQNYKNQKIDYNLMCVEEIIFIMDMKKSH